MIGAVACVAVALIPSGTNDIGRCCMCVSVRLFIFALVCVYIFMYLYMYVICVHVCMYIWLDFRKGYRQLQVKCPE